MNPPPFFSSEPDDPGVQESYTYAPAADASEPARRQSSLPPPPQEEAEPQYDYDYQGQSADPYEEEAGHEEEQYYDFHEPQTTYQPADFSMDAPVPQALEAANSNNSSIPPPFYSKPKSQESVHTPTETYKPMPSTTTNISPEPAVPVAFPPPPEVTYNGNVLRSSTSVPPAFVASHNNAYNNNKQTPTFAPPPAPHNPPFGMDRETSPHLARNRHQSYNIPPPPHHDKIGSPPSASSATTASTYASPAGAAGAPAMRERMPTRSRHHHKLASPHSSPALLTDDEKHTSLDDVSFTSVLRQIDVGVEMTDRLKEVVRKFCKHQQMGADKLQEIYSKMPSKYVDNDGMNNFAELCSLVHTLILETVSAQKRLADLLFKDVVPKMDTYIKDKQQQIQQLKRDNQQAEMKVKNSVNVMHKASNTAKLTASKAKQVAQEAHLKGKRQQSYDSSKKKAGKGGFGGMLRNKFGGGGVNVNATEEEQAYSKAQTNQLNYEAAVMAANYEQDTYNKIQKRFKRDCKAMEHQRLSYCCEKIQQFVNAHRGFFNNETIMVLQTRIMSGLDALDTDAEFDAYVRRTQSTEKGQTAAHYREFVATKYDYQNVFHSLQDAMDITSKLAPHAKLPLMLTVLCDKVRAVKGFETEGIFRKSAMATEIDRLKDQLSRNVYEIDTDDPHVAACLLKDWLRGLKDSLIPQSHYDMAIQMAKSGQIKPESLEVFLSQLPEVNRETIKYLVRFLKELIQKENIGKTRMNIENVAIVFAPTILKCPHTDSKLLLANSRHEKTFTILLIEQLACI